MNIYIRVNVFENIYGLWFRFIIYEIGTEGSNVLFVEDLV